MKQSQNQNNKRGRGRGRRQPQNPLSRNYESNGPDVKIRGNTSHIAEKYQSLARDALSSGDHVSAENYFQHAEHYLRLIASAKDQQKSAENKEGANGQTDAPSEDDLKQKKKPKRKNNGKAGRENSADEVAAEPTRNEEISEENSESDITEPVSEAPEAEENTDAVA